MSQHRWQQVKDCYVEAMALSPEARSAFLSERCAGDEELQHELESLLASHAAEGFLEATAFHSIPRAFIADASDPWVGKQLGAYRIDRVIAIGGMGRVYLATRSDGQYDKQVAIKLMQDGRDRAGLQRRFQIERQTLASLDHPHIARLLDGGITEDGDPYLVMEYVDGAPITAYCQRKRLPLRQRLELFLTVCSAVEFAHRNLVVHRDLKPRNILVDRLGHTRLLDFGIARLLEGETRKDHLTATGTGARAMTLSYASPEQIRGAAITTAQDIYSLGVVLYELLTGQLPNARDGRSDYEIARAVCEDEPTPPSIVAARVQPRAASEFGSETGGPAAAPDDHRSPLRDLRRRLRGDLDNILLTALQKDPSLRYASVKALGDDIRRHLDGLPVHARKHTFAYRTLKLVRRNKALTAAVAAVLVSLVAGLIGTSVGRVAALRAKGEAEAVTDYLNSVFAVANPYRQGRDITVVEQLEEAGARIDRDLSDRPTVEANVRLAIARTYVGMWMWPEAVPHLRRALVLKRELHGPDDPRVAEIMSLLGRSLAFLREPESIPIQEEALRIRERSFGTEHGLVAESRASLGFAIWQTHPERTRESIPMYRDALAMYDRVGLGRHADVGRFTFGLAMMLASVGEADEADVAFRKAISVYTGLGEGHDRYLVECMNRYAHFLVYRAQYDEAEAALLESIELTPDSDGATGPTAPARILSAIHYGRGDHRGAAQSAQTAMVAELRLLASRTSHDDGDIPQLLERIRSAPEVSPSGLAEGFAILAAHSDIVRNGHDRWMIDVSHILAECDSAPSAVAIMETCLKACQGRSPAEPWRVARAQEVLGSHLVRLGRYAEAEHHLAESVNGLRAHFGPDHALTRLAVERMKELYEAWGKPEQAAAFGSSSPVESEPRDPS